MLASKGNLTNTSPNTHCRNGVYVIKYLLIPIKNRIVLLTTPVFYKTLILLLIKSVSLETIRLDIAIPSISNN